MKPNGRPRYGAALPSPDDRWSRRVDRSGLLDRLRKQEPHRLKQFKPLRLGIEPLQDRMLGTPTRGRLTLGRVALD